MIFSSLCSTVWLFYMCYIKKLKLESLLVFILFKFKKHPSISRIGVVFGHFKESNLLHKSVPKNNKYEIKLVQNHI